MPIRSTKRQRGAEIVEFIVTLPVMLIILAFIVEFGALVANQAVVADASRAAARTAIQNDDPLPCSGRTSCNCGIDQDPAWCAAYRTLTAEDGASAFIWWNGVSNPNPTITVFRDGTEPGDDVTATVRHPFRFQLLRGLGGVAPGFDGLTIEAVTHMKMVPF